MVKRSKVLAALLATMMVTTAFVGCGSNDEKKNDGGNATTDNGSTDESKDDDKSESTGKKLTVWSHLQDYEVEALKPIAEEWGEKNGVEVEVLYDDSDFQAYAQAAQSGSGPDIVFGMPHNDLGTFYKAGLLAEVPETLVDKSQYSSDALFDAVTWEGKLCGLPIAQESIALYYNTDKVTEAPATFEDLVNIAKTEGFGFDIGNFYYACGFLTSNGGYIFKNNDGTLDPSDIGLNNAGAKTGLEFLKSLVDDGLMASDITGDIAKAQFQGGETAFYISGPWDIDSTNKSGVNYAIAKLPTLNGKEITNLATVQAAFVSSKCEEQDLAFDLLKYLCENSGETLFEVGSRIPVLTALLEGEKFTTDANMVGFSAQAKVAAPTPNIPDMNTVWDPGANNIKSALTGELDVQAALDNMVEQIKTGIEQQQ